jgi:hypothetical protein
LRDLGALPPIRRVRPTRLMTKTVAAAAIAPLATVLAIIATVVLASSMVPVIKVGEDQVPPPPYSLFGWTLDSTGTPTPNVQVTVTNMATGQSLVNSSDPDFGIYLVDLVPISGGAPPPAGTLIRVEAQFGPETGSNESVVPTPPGGGMWINVTLGMFIPEFEDVVIPIVGMVGMFAIVAAVARSRKDE